MLTQDEATALARDLVALRAVMKARVEIAEDARRNVTQTQYAIAGMEAALRERNDYEDAQVATMVPSVTP